MFAHKAGAQHGTAPAMGLDPGEQDLNYESDTAAVKAAQQAINASGYTPPLPVTGVYDAATQAGAAWAWAQGQSTPFSGHLDTAFLDAFAIDPVKGGYAGTAASSVTKGTPTPGGVQSSSETGTVLAVAGLSAAIGFAFGGPIGAAVGAGVGAIAGVVLHKRAAT